MGGGASTSSPPTFTLNLSNVTQPNNSSNQSSFDSSSSFAPAFFDPHPLLNSTAINVQANNISTLNAQLSMSGSNIQLAPGSSPSFVNGEQGALVFLDDSFLCSNFSSNNSFLSLNSTLHFSFVNFPLVLLINDNFNCSLNTKIDNIFRDPYPAFLFAIIISTYSSGLLHNLDLSQINTPVFTFDSSVGQALQSAVVAVSTTQNS